MLLRIATAVLAAVLLAPLEAAAQLYRPERLQSWDGAPGLSLALSSAGVQLLNDEIDDDFRALDAFGGKRRGMNSLRSSYEEKGGWKLYGRVYLVNFQNNINDREASTKFTWRRSGPKVKGTRIFIAVHRKF